MRRGSQTLGDVPVLIGEVGIPYDVNQSLVKKPGDYRVQITLLDALISAMEKNWASFTLWNYNPSNTVARGDVWNMEDFSIINLEPGARDKDNTRYDEPEYRGGRALEAILRPYACKVSGTPKSTSWHRKQRKFIFTWESASTNPSPLSHVTEIYVPEYMMQNKVPSITVHNGTYTLNVDEQTLYVNTGDHAGLTHTVIIRFPGGTPSHAMGIWLTVIVVIGALLAMYVARV